MTTKPNMNKANMNKALRDLSGVVYETIFAAGAKAIRDLQKLAGKRGRARADGATSTVARTRPTAKPPKKDAPPPPRPVKRSADQIDAIGARACAYLRAHPWSTVEQVAEGIQMRTRELRGPFAKLKGLDSARSAPKLKWMGNKRATVYALAGEAALPPERYRSSDDVAAEPHEAAPAPDDGAPEPEAPSAEAAE